jgi:hypothetical protein
MSLWKDYDETPPEISATLFNKKNQTSNLNHSMFTAAAASLFSRNDNKTRKSIFQEKVQISNGVNLFEDNEPDGEKEVHKGDEVILDPFEKIGKSPQGVKQLNFFSMDSDGDSDGDSGDANRSNGGTINHNDLKINQKIIESQPLVSKERKFETEQTENGINYRQLYEEELHLRLEYEKQIEELTKQVQKLTKQLKGTELPKTDDDIFHQEKVSLTADDRRNMQLNRLKKSAGGNKKKSKGEQQSDPLLSNNSTVPESSQEVGKNKIPSALSSKLETPFSNKLFAENPSDDEEDGSSHPLPPSATNSTKASAPAHNLWASSDEEDEELMTTTTFSSSSTTATSTDMQSANPVDIFEKEKLEKQKARQRQLNQRNRRGASSTISKRRGVSSNGNSSKPSLNDTAIPSENNQSQQTIPRTAGHTWSDDDEDDDEEEEPTQQSPSSFPHSIPASATPVVQQTPSSPSSILALSESSIDHIVMSWCRGKDLLAMIQTLQDVPSMSSSTTELLIGLQSHNIYSQVKDPQDVRKIYL